MMHRDDTLYVLTDGVGVYDERVMASWEAKRAEEYMRESTDGARWWREANDPGGAYMTIDEMAQQYPRAWTSARIAASLLAQAATKFDKLGPDSDPDYDPTDKDYVNLDEALARAAVVFRLDEAGELHEDAG